MKGGGGAGQRTGEPKRGGGEGRLRMGEARGADRGSGFEMRAGVGVASPFPLLAFR